MKIKTRLLVMLSLSLVLPVLAFGAFAQAETETTTETTNTTTKTKPESTTSAVDPKALAERLEKRKTAQMTKLAAAEQVRLKARCKSGQTVVTAVSKRFGNAAANHTKAYKAIDARLSEVAAKLKAKDLDTTELEAQHATLQAKVKAYEANLAAYQQTLADIKNMDCVSDPVAFKASLETARSQREQLSASVVDIREYLNKTIKPTLAKLRTHLEKTHTTSNTEAM